MTIRGGVEKTLGFLRQRATAYKLVFKQPAGHEVLKDLLRFSKLVEGVSPSLPNEFERGRIVGRQDVIRRIQQHCAFTTELLFALYNNLPVPILESEDASNG